MGNATNDQTSIAVFLRQMKFKKKAMGGVDEEDVLDKIKHITRMYQDLTETFQHQNASLQQDNSFLQSQVEQLQTVVQEQDIRLSSLQMENTSLLGEHEMLTAQAQEIVNTMQRYEKERADFIATAQREAQKIILQAQARATDLVEQNEREVKRQSAVHQAEIRQLIDQRQAIEDEVYDLQIKLKGNLRLIAEDLGWMLNLTKELDSKMFSGKDGDELNCL